MALQDLEFSSLSRLLYGVQGTMISKSMACAFVLVLTVLALSSSSSFANDSVSLNFISTAKYWQVFKSNHGKSYAPKEEAKRKAIFNENLVTIVKHNVEYELGLKSFKVGINKFADWSNKEFRARAGLINSPVKAKAGRIHKRSAEALPASKDWREAKDPVRVGPIQDQGPCGSCWTFAVAAAIEGAHAKATGTYTKLSEQNLMDCARGPNFMSLSCQGGIITEGYQYVIDNGLDTLETYKYEAKDLPCRFVNTTEAIGAHLSSYHVIDAGDALGLQDALANVGPVAVSIDAGSILFQLYSSGVYDDFWCAPDGLNHGVTAVGYGETKLGQKYWIVRNSWGSDWGEQGYLKMAAGKNLCGIEELASYPIV